MINDLYNDLVDTLTSEVFDEFNIQQNNNFTVDDNVLFWDYIKDNGTIKGVEICNLDSETFTNVMNEIMIIKNMIKKRHKIDTDFSFYTIGRKGFIKIKILK